MEVKECPLQCPLSWWGKHESIIPIVSFFTCQIMGIVGSQIEMDIMLFQYLLKYLLI